MGALTDPLRRLPHVVAVLILMVFAVANARGLDSTPPVNQDEAWIAAPGVEFFESGRFATPLFAGYYGSERYYYDFMPLYSLLNGAAIQLFGMSLVTVRAVSLSLAVLTLWLTYLVGRRLLSAWHGVAAILILGFWPIAAADLPPLTSHATGIPLADLGRIGRYDILVPVFGLASLLALIRGLETEVRAAAWLALAGAMAGLSTLSHYYGVIFLVVILVITNVRRGFKPLAWPLLGFVVALAPWLWFISLDFAVFLAQKQEQARNYAIEVGNLGAELRRFAPVLSAAARGHFSTLLWCALAAVGLGILIRSAWGRDREAQFLTIVIAVVIVCYALFVRQTYRYLGTMWPLLALAAAAAVLHPWTLRLRDLARGALVLLMAAASIQGLQAYFHLAQRARHHTPYSAICDRIAREVPGSARLLALQHWWLGLSPRVSDYRSFHVPIARMNQRDAAKSISFEEAMALDPMDYILIDPSMRDVLRSAHDPSRPVAGPLAVQLADFLERRAVLVDAFDNVTYGRFALYRIKDPGAIATRR